MTSLRQWLGVQAQTSLGVAVALFLCSPMGAAVALAGGPTDAVAENSRAGTVRLGGLTSNGWPVHIQLARNGKLIVRAVGAIELPCTKGGSMVFKDKWDYVAVRRSTFKAVYRDSFTDEGATIEVDDSFTGKVNRARTAITGTWRNKMVVREPDGSIDTCDSGVLRFTARR